MPEGKRNVARKHKVAAPSDAAKVPIAFAALSSSIGFSLRRAQISTFQEFTEAMEKHGIRPSQFAVLVLIRSNPGLKQSAISKALGIQKANFVALLDRLEKRGLTERRTVGGDRRSFALHLTRAGEISVARMEAAHLAFERGLIKRLGPTRSKLLLQLLNDFSERGQSHIV
jgi:DNA-binding MarR family transcriptional regulator